MRDFVIITDSSSDLPVNVIKKYNIKVIPMSYLLDGVEHNLNYMNSVFKNRDFYEKLRKGSSAQSRPITTFEYQDFIKKYLEEDYDVIIICVASLLSDNYDNLQRAKNNLQILFPKHNIIIFDSVCASMGLGLLTYLSALEKEKEKSIFEVERFLQNTHQSICHWMVTNNLEYLKQSGRLYGGVLFIGGLLKFIPILHMEKSGKIVSVKKVIGKSVAYEELFQKMKETAINVQNQVIFIAHADSYDDALTLKNRILTEFYVKDIVIGEMGPITGSNVGPDALALFFLGSER